MFANFKCFALPGEGATIRGVVGGSGPPLLLLHGYPQTHVMWHKVAPLFAQHYTVVAADLRGYGASDKPASDDLHTPYSKRAVAADMVRVMERLGHKRFFVGAHDRGARVAHRLAIDWPECVVKQAFLDIAPTREMYRDTDAKFAQAYWHWFFLIQASPFPENLINADSDAYLTKKCGSGSAGLSPFTKEALAHYLNAFRDPATVHASCEDYRAAASIDIEHDDADGDYKIQQPLLCLWGKSGVIEACFDPLALWRERAEDVRGYPLPGGHYLAEELPQQVYEALHTFYSDPAPEGQA